MAWAGAFGAAASGSSSSAPSSSPTPGQHSKSGAGSYSSFGYPPTPPKESPGGGATPASLTGDTGAVYHETGVTGEEGVAGERLEMKPSADHLMQSMALSGYPVGRTHSHKHTEGKNNTLKALAWIKLVWKYSILVRIISDWFQIIDISRRWRSTESVLLQLTRLFQQQVSRQTQVKIKV